MNHTQAEELVARRSELTAGEETRLEEHLAGCPRCRETAQAYARQTALLRSLPLAAPPPALRAAVLSGIAERPRRRWAFRPLFALAPLGVLTTAVLAAVLLQHLPSGSGHNSALSTGRKNGPVPAAQATPSRAALTHPKMHPTHPPHRPLPVRHRTTRPGSPPPTATGGSGYTVAAGPITNTPYGAYTPPATSGAAGAQVPPPTPLPTARKPVLTVKSHPTRPASTSAPATGVPSQPVTGGGRPPVPPAPRPPSPAPKPSATLQPTPPTVVVAAPTRPTPSATVTAPPPVSVTTPSSPVPLPTPTP